MAPIYRQDMVYELRIYHIVPGRMDDIEARFRDHTFELFERHAIDVVGFWRKRDADELIYVCRYPDADAMQASWSSFRADPEWQEVKRRTEAKGPIVRKVESEILDESVWQS